MAKPAWSLEARTGTLRNFQDLKIFACEGLICIIDERPQYHGECRVVTPHEFAQRVDAAGTPYRQQTRGDLPKWKRKEHDKQLAELQGCLDAIKEAKAQGDPSDPAVQAWWQRHRRNSTIKFSSGTSAAGYPTLPPLPMGVGVSILGGEATNSPTKLFDILDHSPVHTPPRRRNSLIIPRT